MTIHDQPTGWSSVFILVKCQSTKGGHEKFRLIRNYYKTKNLGGRGQRHITEKLPLRIQTVEDIYVKMTQNDLECNRDIVLKPCSVFMALGVYVHCYLYHNSTSTEKLSLKIEGGGGQRSDVQSCKNCKFTRSFDVIPKI